MLSPAGIGFAQCQYVATVPRLFHNKMMQFGIGDTQRSPGTCSRSFQSAFPVGPHGKPFRMFFAILRPHVRNTRDHMRGRENTRFLDLGDSAVSAMVDFHRSAVGISRLVPWERQACRQFLPTILPRDNFAALFFRNKNPSARFAASPNHQYFDRAAAA